MTLDRVDCRRTASASSSPSSRSSSFLHGVKKAVILLCPGDDQASRSVGPGRAVRVQFATPTTAAAAAAGDTELRQRPSAVVDTDR